ncbi:MAG: HypC/HybG/HupF family hydrogenase formation chaperone [Candidatus Goldiibacteriota bacterium]
MCLAMPGKVLKKNKNKAVVDFNGIEMEIDITLTPEIKKGEYCLVHAGFAIEQIDEEYALESKKYLEELNAAQKKN